MLTKFDPHTPYFRGVAMAFIVLGSAIVAVGVVEWILNYASNDTFNDPLLKLLAGIVIIILGYIHLELELIRISRR